MTRTPFAPAVLGAALAAALLAAPAAAGTLVLEGGEAGDVTVQYTQLPPGEATAACADMLGLGPDDPPAAACAQKLNRWRSPCIVILPRPVSPGILIHELIYRCHEGRFGY